MRFNNIIIIFPKYYYYMCESLILNLFKSTDTDSIDTLVESYKNLNIEQSVISFKLILFTADTLSLSYNIFSIL